MTDDAAALAQSLGVLLAVYVFGFDLTRRRLDEIDELQAGEGWEDMPGPMVDEARAARRRARRLMPLAFGFAIAPFIVVLVYLPVVIDVIKRVDVDRPYNAARATVVLLELAFFGLGVWQCVRARDLVQNWKWYRQHEEWSKRARAGERKARLAAKAKKEQPGASAPTAPEAQEGLEAPRPTP